MDGAKLWGKKRKFNAIRVTTTQQQHTTNTTNILKYLQYESNLSEFGSDIFVKS